METEKTLNKEALKELPKKNHTSFMVLKDLSERQRTRFETDIDRNAMKLLNKGLKVNTEQYLQVWKDLEELGAGVIIWGRNGNSNRFKWNYSLKDVGTAAVNPDAIKENVMPLPFNSEKDINPPKKRYKKSRKSGRGRPVGSKNRPKIDSNVSYTGITLAVKDLSGQFRSISLEEAMKVADQVIKLKELTQVA